LDKKYAEHEQWLREAEKMFNRKISRNSFDNKWHEMLNSKAAKSDPKLMSAIKQLLRS
jgi:hypothetical protein